MRESSCCHRDQRHPHQPEFEIFFFRTATTPPPRQQPHAAYTAKTAPPPPPVHHRTTRKLPRTSPCRSCRPCRPNTPGTVTSFQKFLQTTTRRTSSPIASHTRGLLVHHRTTRNHHPHPHPPMTLLPPLPPKHTRYRDFVLEVFPEILESTSLTGPIFLNSQTQFGPREFHVRIKLIQTQTCSHPTHTTQIDYKTRPTTHVLATLNKPSKAFHLPEQPRTSPAPARIRLPR